jgi:hypothetical protein
VRLPQPGGPDPCIYIPQKQGGPVILPGTDYVGTAQTILNSKENNYLIIYYIVENAISLEHELLIFLSNLIYSLEGINNAPYSLLTMFVF